MLYHILAPPVRNQKILIEGNMAWLITKRDALMAAEHGDFFTDLVARLPGSRCDNLISTNDTWTANNFRRRRLATFLAILP
jgi:hypothetical protein